MSELLRLTMPTKLSFLGALLIEIEKNYPNAFIQKTDQWLIVVVPDSDTSMPTITINPTN